jgi:putative transposase
VPRANRYFMPGYVWHITHRCHKQEFLLKFAQTRQRYIHWLYQARKRFGVEILNYAITSNHILCGAPHKICYVNLELM